MNREDLRKQFSSMLIRTDTLNAWLNLGRNYLMTDKDYVMLAKKDRNAKLKELKEGNPREWISKIFTEGLDIPERLYKVNILWLKHLEEIGL